MITPPIDGPITRLPLTIEELSAIAFGRSAAILDHLHDERLTRRRVERVDRPLQHLQHDQLRNGDDIGSVSAGKRRRLQQRQDLRDEQDSPPVVPVDDHAGQWREQQRWYLSAETDDAEQQLRAGQSVDQPARRHTCDPCPDQRNALAAEEKPVVAVAERPGQRPYGHRGEECRRRSIGVESPS